MRTRNKAPKADWAAWTIKDRDYRVTHHQQVVRARLHRDATAIKAAHRADPDRRLPDIAEQEHQDLSYVHKILAHHKAPARAILLNDAHERHPDWSADQLAAYVDYTAEEKRAQRQRAARLRKMGVVPGQGHDLDVQRQIMMAQEAHPTWTAHLLARHLGLPNDTVQVVLEDQEDALRADLRLAAAQTIRAEDRQALERSAHIRDWSEAMLGEAMINLQDPWVPMAHKNALRHSRADPLIYGERGQVLRTMRHTTPPRHSPQDELDRSRTYLWIMFAQLENDRAPEGSDHLSPAEHLWWKQHVARTRQHLEFVEDVLRRISVQCIAPPASAEVAP